MQACTEVNEKKLEDIVNSKHLKCKNSPVASSPKEVKVTEGLMLHQQTLIQMVDNDLESIIEVDENMPPTEAVSVAKDDASISDLSNHGPESQE